MKTGCYEVEVSDNRGEPTGLFIGWNQVKECWTISRGAHCFQSRSEAAYTIKVFTRNPNCDHLNFDIIDIEPEESELESLAV